MTGLIGPFNLAMRSVQWAQVHLYLTATQTVNQSLGRFLVFAAIELPLGYWALAGATLSVRLNRMAMATGLLAVADYGLEALRWQEFVPPWSWLLHAIVVGLLIHLAGLLDQWAGDL